MSIFGQFATRTEAGKALGERLCERGFVDPVVLALPRGGVPVAVEIARALHAPLDLVLVRKIGVPFQRELAAAAVVDGGEPEIIVNEDVVALAGLSKDDIEEQAKVELIEIERRRRVYLEGRARVPLNNRVLVLVDDGIATGASIRAAIAGLRRKQPSRLVLAVPVAPQETIEALRAEVDEVVCLVAPELFCAIGAHYRDFHQLGDEEVVRILREAQVEYQEWMDRNLAKEREGGKISTQ